MPSAARTGFHDRDGPAVRARGRNTRRELARGGHEAETCAVAEDEREADVADKGEARQEPEADKQSLAPRGTVARRVRDKRHKGGEESETEPGGNVD